MSAANAELARLRAELANLEDRRAVAVAQRDQEREQLAAANALLADIESSVNDAARKCFSLLSQPLEDRLRAHLSAHAAPAPTEDQCPLCDGTGKLLPDVTKLSCTSDGYLLCGACSDGRPDDCSGWCGRKRMQEHDSRTAAEARVLDADELAKALCDLAWDNGWVLEYKLERRELK